MVSNPSLIHYACVSKGSIVLAEFNSKDADLKALAAKCLEKTPPLHTFYSHTVRNKTYTFLIDSPFAFFAIYDDKIRRSEGLAFLKILNDSFKQISGTDKLKGLENLSSYCFQSELNPVFHQLLSSHVDLDVLQSPPSVVKLESCGSLDSPRGRAIGVVPLLGRDNGKGLKKKKRTPIESNGDAKDALSENKLDVSDDAIGLHREFTSASQKNGLFSMDSGQQRAKRVWKRQVWVVLSLDFIVCTILFGIWLSICRGFKCIDG